MCTGAWGRSQSRYSSHLDFSGPGMLDAFQENFSSFQNFLKTVPALAPSRSGAACANVYSSQC